MAAYPPPDPAYFTNINFNPSFYNQLTGAFITASQVAAKYLNKLTGGTITGILKILYSTTDQTQFSIQNTNNTSMSSLILRNNDSSNSTGIGIFGTNNVDVPYLTNKAFITSSTDLSLLTNNGFLTPTLQLLGNRNVGLGITNPNSLLHIHNPVSAGEVRISFSDVSSGTTTTDGFAIIKDGAEEVSIWNYENNSMRFGTNNTEQIRILSNGNIGIGITNPSSALEIYRSAVNTSFITMSSSGNPDNTCGIYFKPLSTRAAGAAAGVWGVGDGAAAAHLILGTTSGSGTVTERMRILNNGNVGIGTNNPENIFQVGSGGRLKISNGTPDYTLIGTKNTDDATNTKIVISGSARTGNIGCIDYYAISSISNHKFYVNGNLNFSVENNNINLRKTPRTIDCTYENGGYLLPYTTRINVGGTTLGGYFIPIQNYTNSTILGSFSHDSTSYTYWGGHITIGNTNQILNITAPINGYQLMVETFTEQGTLMYYIRVFPTVSYSTAVNLRVKMYG